MTNEEAKEIMINKDMKDSCEMENKGGNNAAV